MTPRERVLAALNHVEPDRVPIDLSGHRSSGIAAMAYPKLRKYLGLPPRPIHVYDVIQQLAVVDEDVLDRFGIDCIEMGRGFALTDDSWKPWTLPDGTDCLVPAWTRIERRPDRWVILSESGKVFAHMPDGTLYFEQTHFPLMKDDGSWMIEEQSASFACDHQSSIINHQSIVDAFGECMWTGVAAPPGPVDPQALRKGAKRLRESTSRAIIGLFGGNLFETGQFFYRADNFFMLLAGEPQKAHRFLDQLVEIHLANLEKFLGAVGDSIDIILFGDDLGMQTGPMLSPKMYCEFFKPRHKVLWNRAKELANVKVMLHCCGGVRELLPHLIEAGLDTINPVQITCAGMNPAELKAEFGRDLTFWGGGCDTREILAGASPKQVAEHVRNQVRTLSPGGGFVFQQVHNILANVPPENIVAMLDAVNADR
ncbi:MAG: methyltransferase [Phycisphaerae bacterium]|nr:methyltransferase [Phycisphaerae bacterium]